ncbi:OB-fold protein [Neisseria sp. Ec49-e6-T10]|uniref:OB-fold protein n=1 Tax=Neisseria sp. Ec49-e6-T10 TaxID=3140744 RepID=UPI003EB71294
MKRFFKWAAIILVILIVIGIIFGDNKKGGSKIDNSQTSVTSPKVSSAQEDSMTHSSQEETLIQTDEPVIEVTADELLKAYKTNEMAANKKYKSKQLSVSGRIDNIQADITDKAFVTLKAGGQFEIITPQARFKDSEEDKILELKKGQKVKLLCVGGGEIMGAPMLEHCIFQ